MATRKAKAEPTAEELHAEWVARLTMLYDRVEPWARELDWVTRRIEIKRRDDLLGGVYTAPALLMQHNAVRVMLDPLARHGVGNDGIVDFYVMPAWDRVAVLTFNRGRWAIQWHSAIPVGEPPPIPMGPLTREVVQSALAAWGDLVL